MTNDEGPTEEAIEVAVSAAPWRIRARRWASWAVRVRPAVGFLGAAGIVFGAIIAWRSSSATTLLIVSAALLVLAVIGLDWDTIRGSWSGLTIELARLGSRLDQAAASEDVPAAVKEELEALRDEVRAIAVTTASTSPWRLPRAMPLSPLIVGAAMPTHTFRESGGVVDGVTLTVAVVPSADGFTCAVETPGGQTYTKATRRSIALTSVSALLPVRYMVTYPDDFEGSEPLGPGAYTVEWRPSVSTPPPEGISPIVWALGQPPLAKDSFTIPESRAERNS